MPEKLIEEGKSGKDIAKVILIAVFSLLLVCCLFCNQKSEKEKINATLPTSSTVGQRVEPLPVTTGPVPLGAHVSQLADGSFETNTGLRYVDLKVGSGQYPPKGSLVTVHYTG